MNSELFERFKESFSNLQSDAEAVKSAADEIIATIESDRFVSVELAEKTINTIEAYRERFEELKKAGTELAIDTEANISSISTAISAMEDSQKLLSERQTVLDFLRLSTDADEYIDRLIEAKARLIEKCRAEDPRKELEPFKIVVDSVRNPEKEISDDELDAIEDGIEKVGKYIGRAADRRKLVIDEALDISDYLDGSCLLLEKEKDRKNPVEQPEDKKNPLEQPEDKETYLWDEFDGFIDDIEYDITDVSEEELVPKEFAKLLKEDDGLAEVLTTIALRTAITDKDTFYTKKLDKVKSLTSSGYIRELTFEQNGRHIKTFSLTSKGYAALNNLECRNAISKIDKSLLLPVGIIEIKAKTGAMVFRAALLNRFYTNNNYFVYCFDPCIEYPYMCETDNGDSFLKTSIGMFSKACAMDEVAGLSEAILAPDEDLEKIVILTASETDSAKIADALNLPEEVAQKIEYRVVDFFGDIPDLDQAEKISWESIGISNPESLVFIADDEKVTVIKSQKANGKFGAKDFKHDIRSAVSSEDASARRNAIVLAAKHGVITPMMIGVMNDINTEVCELSCKKLTDLGYLVKYTYDEKDSYFALSSKGAKALDSKEASDYLQVKRKPAIPFVAENGKAAVTAALYAKALSSFVSAQIKEKNGTLKCSVGAHSFIITCNTNEEISSSVVFAGIVSNQADDFSEYCVALSEGLAGVDTLVAIGADINHAKALGNWFSDRFKANMPDLRFAYGDLERGVAFDLSTGVEIDIFTADISLPVTGTEEKQTNENDVETDEKTDDTVSASTDKQEKEKPAEIKRVDIVEDKTEEVQKTDTAEPDIISKHVLEMLSEGKPYCAAAYLYSLAQNDAKLSERYRMLAYALDDPLEDCKYSSDEIFNVFFKDEKGSSPCLTLSAALRNFFYDSGYDYSLSPLLDAMQNGNRIVNDIPKLKNVMASLVDFRKSYNYRGIDFYSDYRQVRAKTAEKRLEYSRTKAKEAYESFILNPPKESTNMKRFLETKKIVFAKGGDIGTYLEAAAKDEKDFLTLIEKYLKDTFLKQGSDIASRKIDATKVEDFIDSAWAAAAEEVGKAKKFTPLVGHLRTNLIKQIEQIVRILCDYAVAAKSYEISESDNGYIGYKKIRESVLQDMKDSLGAINEKKESLPEGERDVLIGTLEELIARIEGTYNEEARKYFYLPFLKSDKVLLDGDYLPIFANIENLPSMSPTERILEHFNSPEQSIEARLEAILDGGDDYGSAELLFKYFESRDDAETDLSEMRHKLDEGKKHPLEDISLQRENFKEELELAQSYGQIDNTVENIKEEIVQIVDRWYDWAIENENFGFFNRIIEKFRIKIKDDSKTRAFDLEKHLAAYKAENPNWENEELPKLAVGKIKERIECQNYAAAEDLLNRLSANDLETVDRFSRKDFFDTFLNEYSDNVKSTRNCNEKPNVDFHVRNKETKAAQDLLNNWPMGNPVKKEKVDDLLKLMGFKINQVREDRVSGSKYDRFSVSLKRPGNGRKEDYSHPIAIFGSEAEASTFTVLFVNGKLNPEGLLSAFTSYGGARNTIILLNYSLTLPERRELARISKKEFSGKTFAVIDRVVLVFLAKHYSEATVNRMLMSVIMPFAAYQPYVPDSSKTMPPEMFMGRKTELLEIESAAGVNIVYGGRQLGKSALLKMARNDINNNEKGDRAVYVDIKGKDYKQAAKKIAAELYDEGILDKDKDTEDWDELARAIKNVLRNDDGIPYLLLLLDEADVFIDSCKEVNYKPFDALKDIQQLGTERFKFVIAGLRNIVRFNKSVALGNNSVLAHLSSRTVTPFKIAEARELFEEPLNYLGFRFPDDNKTEMLISTILGTTNYFPGLIQLYCAKLIEALKKDYAGYDENDTPPYMIKEEHIKKVLADKTLIDQIRDKFMITLKVDEDDYYYLIALIVAYHYHNSKEYNGTAAEDVLKTADEFAISKITSLNIEEITALMDEMRELNVFRSNSSGRYFFSRQNFCEMMGSVKDIDDKILEYADGGED